MPQSPSEWEQPTRCTKGAPRGSTRDPFVSSVLRLPSVIRVSDWYTRHPSKIGLTSEEVRQCTFNALDAAFCDEATRDAVRAKLDAYVWPHEREQSERALATAKRRAALVGVALVGAVALGVVLVRSRLAGRRS